MSLADFAFQSSQREITRKQVNNQNAQFKKVQKLISSIHEETLKCSKRNEISSSITNDHDDTESLYRDLRILFEMMMNDSLSLSPSPSPSSSSINNHSRKRTRPWTAQTSSMSSRKLLTTPFPSLIGEKNMFRISSKMLLKMKKSDISIDSAIADNEANDENTFPMQRTFLTAPQIPIWKADYDLKQKTKLILMTSSAKRRKEKKDKQVLLLKKQLQNHNEVRKMLEMQDEGRINAFQLRDQRIDHAKLRRFDLRNDQLQKLEENMYRKEQKRLDHLSMKKKGDRQYVILTNIFLASTTYRWLHGATKLIVKYRYKKSLNEAATKIQSRWKKEMFSRKAMESRMIHHKLKKLSWRLRLWSRCARRRLNARIIRCLFNVYIENPLPFLIYKFRSKVLKAQRLIRSFIECKGARLLALEICWDNLETHVISESSMRSANKKRGRKNALTDITHRKMLLKSNNTNQGHIANKLVNVIIQSRQNSTQTNIFTLGREGNIGKEKSQVEREMCQHLCRFYLEDSRRSHMNQIEDKIKEEQSAPFIDRNQAILLLAGEDVDVHVYPPINRWPLFSLFRHRKEALRKVIKDMRCDEKKARQGIEDRLKLESVISEANRYASDPIVQKSTKPDYNEHEIAREFKCEIKVVRELRQVFQLIDFDGDGVLSFTELGRLHKILGYESNVNEQTVDKKNETIDFRTFLMASSACQNEAFPYSKTMVLDAFEYFSRDTNEYEISKDNLLNVLQSYDGKWEESHASNILAGFSSVKNIQYEEFVSSLFSVWSCKNIYDLLDL